MPALKHRIRLLCTAGNREDARQNWMLASPEKPNQRANPANSAPVNSGTNQRFHVVRASESRNMATPARATHLSALRRPELIGTRLSRNSQNEKPEAIRRRNWSVPTQGGAPPANPETHPATWTIEIRKTARARRSHFRSRVRSHVTTVATPRPRKETETRFSSQKRRSFMS